MREAVVAPPGCRDCVDLGEFQFAGDLYCGRCALERLVRALRAEIDAGEFDVELDGEGILVDR